MHFSCTHREIFFCFSIISFLISQKNCIFASRFVIFCFSFVKGIDYSFHAYTNTYGYESYYDTIRSAESNNTCEWTPQYTGTYIVKVLAQDTGGDWSEAEDKLTIKVSNSSSSSSDATSDDDSGISLPKYGRNYH